MASRLLSLFVLLSSLAIVRVAAQRSIAPYLTVCYGPGSICGAWLDLDDKCTLERGTPSDYPKWYRCMCESGWLLARQYCDDCNALYRTDFTGNADFWGSKCVSSTWTYTTGAMPQSVYDGVSSHNAQVTAAISTTYFPPGSGAGPTSTGDSAEETASAQPASTPAASSSRPTSRASLSAIPAATTTGGGFDFGFPTSGITLSLNGSPTAPVPTIVVTVVPTVSPGSASSLTGKTELRWSLAFVCVSSVVLSFLGGIFFL